MLVGAGVCVEKSVEDAITRIDEQIMDVMGMSQQIKNEAKEIYEVVQKIQDDIKNGKFYTFEQVKQKLGM